MKKLRLFVIAILIVLLAGVGGSIIYYNNSISAVSSQSEEVIFEVSEGSTYQGVISNLYDKGLIKNTTIAKLYLKFNDVPTLKANTYKLDKNMNLETIFDILGNGYFEYLVTNKFTIVEGSTVPKVAEVLASFLTTEETLVSANDVIAKLADTNFLTTLIAKYWFLTDDILDSNIMFPLEGYLYPETYVLSSTEVNIETVIYAILDRTNAILTGYKSQIENSGMSVHEFLTFSSIVERESLFDSDKPKIAGVFMNRLEIDMRIQSDITVLYALQEQRINVTYADLEVDSLYNTYKYSGLPIGPVSNVSSSTMQASLNYEHNDYYYFFACADGTVIYSRTVEEHDQAATENKWW